MSRHETFNHVVSGASDANVGFDDLRRLLRALGFIERIRGSHHIFRRPGVIPIINLQRDGAKAKPYQVRQVRRVLIEYALGGGLLARDEED